MIKTTPRQGFHATYVCRAVRISWKCYVLVEIKCQLDATDDFYFRSYCLLNMFRAPLCPSSGAREYYTEGYVSGLRAATRKPDT